MIHIPSGVRDSSEAEIRELEDVCNRLGGFNPEVSIDWLDGALTALAAGPRVPEPEAWREALLGDAFGRAFGDPESAALAARVLDTRLKVLQAQLDPQALLDQPEQLRLAPLMMAWTDDDRAALVKEGQATEAEAVDLQTGDLWADGFMAGMEAFPEIWVEPTEESAAESFDILFDQVAALMWPPADPQLAAHIERYWPKDRPAPTREQLIDEALFAIQDLRIWWLDNAPRPATRRVEAPPGRNDPCPCGSGRKYKKCHGAAA